MGLLAQGCANLGFVGGAEVDRFGNLNTSYIGDRAASTGQAARQRRRRGYRLAGGTARHHHGARASSASPSASATSPALATAMAATGARGRAAARRSRGGDHDAGACSASPRIRTRWSCARGIPAPARTMCAPTPAGICAWPPTPTRRRRRPPMSYASSASATRRASGRADQPSNVLYWNDLWKDTGQTLRPRTFRSDQGGSNSEENVPQVRGDDRDSQWISLGVHAGVPHYRRLGHHRADLQFLRYLAARHQYGNNHRHVPDGLPHPEHPEPRLAWRSSSNSTS